MPKSCIFFPLLYLFLSSNAQQDEFIYTGFSAAAAAAGANGGRSNISMNGAAVIKEIGILHAVEVPPLPGPAEYYDAGKSNVGFDDFVHSYPSSSFEKVSTGSAAAGEEALGPTHSPLSRVSHSHSGATQIESA
ncbi:hypothetical protein Cni_G23765 [Canna indica]|uniref:Uncharacterized protein n=1 Tax=Canna indica TaxID=4628 RepID=A0AAQ3QKT1_9LILI|nr:hypothetical protein Cni_G23765 [Canna indica]